MSDQRSWQAVNRYLETQSGELERQAKRARAASTEPFITLSRQAGTGGFDLAARIAHMLEAHEAVLRVNHPGLSGNVGHHVANHACCGRHLQSSACA